MQAAARMGPRLFILQRLSLAQASFVSYGFPLCYAVSVQYGVSFAVGWIVSR